MHRGTLRLLLMLAVGIVAWAVTAALGATVVAPVVGWTAACAAYIARTAWVVHGLDAEGTRDHALVEDPTRRVTESILLLATVASLGAVAVILLSSGRADAASRVYAGLAVLSVAVSWLMIHTIFTLRYAAAYFGDPPGGIDFNTDQEPRYVDFAYVAFTVGMTYQIADTDLESTELRSEALRHGLLSYLFGTVIMVTAINLALSLVQ